MIEHAWLSYNNNFWDCTCLIHLYFEVCPVGPHTFDFAASERVNFKNMKVKADKIKVSQRPMNFVQNLLKHTMVVATYV
jgi:hypothetical protein